MLGNGDIWEAADALRMVDETGCDGVVVGRGCLGRPWLFRDLAAAFAGRPAPPLPTLGEVADMIERHGQLLADLMGEHRGMRDLRKHMAWYLKGFVVGQQTRAALGLVGSLQELSDLLGSLERDQPLPARRARTSARQAGQPSPGGAAAGVARRHRRTTARPEPRRGRYVRWVGPRAGAAPPGSRVCLVVSLTLSLVLVGCDATETSSESAHPLGGEAVEQRFPDIVAVELVPVGDQVYDVTVTVSSPYDTAERYADGWRVLAPDGTVLGEHQLLARPCDRAAVHAYPTRGARSRHAVGR